MQGIGPLELAIVLVIVLLIFGPKRLPGLGKQLGSGMREFKDSISGKSRDKDDDDEGDRAHDTRSEANAALGRPAADEKGQGEAVEGEVVSERR